MNYIKTYEKYTPSLYNEDEDDKPEINDYVICDLTYLGIGQITGQIKTQKENYYIMEFVENISDDWTEHAMMFHDSIKNKFHIYPHDIIFLTKNIEDLITYKNATKYNL